MTAEQLLKNIIAYGADEAGIADRFGGNAALYELCLKDLTEGAYTGALAEAMRAQDYARAFEAAHALKGLAGNLGLTPYYKAICALVEALRAGRYGEAAAEYAAAERELTVVQRVCAGKPNAATAPPQEARGAKKPTASDALRRDRFFALAVYAILAVFIIAAASFYAVSHNYREKNKYESGQHLLETGRQIALYLEERVTSDWRIAQSIGRLIVRSGIGADDAALLAMLKDQKEAWGVTDILLYTRDGNYVGTDGKRGMNGTGSAAAAAARQNGRAVSIIESSITYTLALDTAQTYGGAKIVAVAVVHDVAALLDDMDFTSYGNAAWAYLVEDNGVVLSRLTRSGSRFTFNVKSLFENSEITQLSKTDASTDVFAHNSIAAFYMKDGTEEKYVVSVPIDQGAVGGAQTRLFYIVPEEVVNDTMNDFSRQLTVFSIVIVALLVGLASLAFLSMYRSRKREFDAGIMAREHMFDLLIQNMRTVFALFDTKSAHPVYISANAEAVLGEKYWTIRSDEAGYRAYTGSGVETPLLLRANERLRAWDGKGVFRSGYLSDEATPPAWFEMILYPVAEEGSDIVGIMQDVTAAHEREEITRSALAMAKRSDEAKTRFLANMSHDIRTPMNAIMNMSRFALESADEPHKHEEYLQTIYDASEHLLHLINDVLDMSRIESGQAVIASTPFDIKAELLKQIETIRPLAEAKRQQFLVDMEGLRVRAVRGDALKVTQIVLNLLSNAIKFTPEGGAVRFTARELPALREDMAAIRFIVEDNGIGISAENKACIFEPFARARDKRVNWIEGTGLGLSICKSYVDAMGGSIKCESEEGEGSIFTVELFLQRATLSIQASVGASIESSTPFAGMRCLVAEDIDTNRKIARTLLERLGFSVDIVLNGGECVHRILASRPNTYDVIYMDIQMPVLDGYEAAVAIRRGVHPQAASIPIVAMSANVFAEDIEKARIAGMDGYVGKPLVTLEIIEQTIKAMEIKKGSAL